jgi:hypothetical protein
MLHCHTIDHPAGSIKPPHRFVRTSSTRARHRFPPCLSTGKRRLGERKDVKLALRAARQARSVAHLAGVESARHEVRGYRCPDCHGWHLTSMASPPISLA